MDVSERSHALSAMLGCAQEPAAALAQAMVPRDYPSKTFLIHQGDVNAHLWLVLGGTVQLQSLSAEGQSTVISSFGPGELVGAFPDENETTFDAQAFGKVASLQIAATDLRNLLDDWPDLGVGLAGIFAGQLETVLDRLSARVTLSAIGRVYRELLRLADGKREIAPPPVVSALALTAQTTRETASRAISELERRGIIERDSNRLTIVSPRMLEELVI